MPKIKIRLNSQPDSITRELAELTRGYVKLYSHQYALDDGQTIQVAGYEKFYYLTLRTHMLVLIVHASDGFVDVEAIEGGGKCGLLAKTYMPPLLLRNFASRVENNVNIQKALVSMQRED